MTFLSDDNSTGRVRRRLTLFDATCVIVGIIVGAGIFESSPWIASSVGSPAALLGIWLIGAAMALVGALCYAELTTTYPSALGGDYFYLKTALGRKTAFLFAWSEFWIVRPGNIGAMAYIFAHYAIQILPWIPDKSYRLPLLAAASVVVLTGIHLIGLTTGKQTQNLLTVAKVVGLLGVVLAGLMFVSPQAKPAVVEEAASTGGADYRLALILVMFCYGGWGEMSFVAAEVRRPRRNLLRALLLGTLGVAAVYLLINLAFLHCLGFEGLRGADAVAAEVLKVPLGSIGGMLVSLLICISCLGVVAIMIFTGARIPYAVAADFPWLEKLNRWNQRRDTPVRAILCQSAVVVLLIVLFGPDRTAFERLVIFTAPFFWFFLALVGCSFFVLRGSDADRRRPFRVPLYPILPLLFVWMCGFMCYSGVEYAATNGRLQQLWVPVVLLLIGLVLVFWLDRRKKT